MWEKDREETSKNSVNSTSPVSIDPVRKEISEMIAQVVEARADEGSDEFFFASQLFMKKECHDVFINLKTPSGRLACVRRTWEEKKKRRWSIYVMISYLFFFRIFISICVLSTYL